MDKKQFHERIQYFVKQRVRDEGTINSKMCIRDRCEQEQIPFREGNFTLDELYAADEVIVADTNTECSAVLKVDGHTIRDGTPGPILKQLQKAYEAAIIAECGKAE